MSPTSTNEANFPTSANILPAGSMGANPLSNDATTLTDEQRHELLTAAAAAPSADNNQPWKFAWTDSRLNVYWDLERRLPSDQSGMFDVLSLGAAVENVTLVASTLGQLTTVSLPTKIDLASSETTDALVATIEFQNSDGAKQIEASEARLADSIYKRRTTRAPFRSSAVEQAKLESLSSVIADDEAIELRWMVERRQIHQAASLVALSDSLRFRYQEFHEELHRQLRLSAAEAERSRDGLDYRTLGLPWGAQWVLRCLRPWKTMALLNRMGAAQLMSIPSAKLVRQSGAIGFLYIPNKSHQAMIAGGRAMQRVWLQATHLGLSLHPLGSLPIFLGNESLPPELESIGSRLHERASGLIPSSDGILQMAFRLGTTKREPKTRSLRRAADNLILSTIESTGT